MENNYEVLGDERFQQLIQALLVERFPKLTCLPVAQPDGGRDAFAYTDFMENKFIVFQVKFSREPNKIADTFSYFKQIIDKETPKVEKLIERGATEYYFVTNLKGSSHLDVGSVDKINEYLRTKYKIPSVVWWRDDIDRRLDSNFDIRWNYPELLKATDLLKVIIENKYSEEGERRTNTLISFLKDQLMIDEQVKFKQIELQNNLLELFIDVPLVIESGQNIYLDYYRHRSGLKYSTDFDWTNPWDSKQKRGAVSFLIDEDIQKNVPRIVLEGAPGQGKSTIAQFICQIYRMKLLGKAEYNKVAEKHRIKSIRIPIKVDLRDFATWLKRKNPFLPTEEIMDTGWQKSLESFLAMLISYHSGGAAFSVSDLQASFKISRIILVFDGLDEVADINIRQEVVDEITKGIKRLEEVAKSVFVIVTSRPTAFTNSPGFSGDSFDYFHLDSLERKDIEEYSEKWMNAKRLEKREKNDFRKILNEKLDQPHMKDLARNTMQLAILLSLIHTRGSSLPEKRTELYDSYVELFFNREAQKSSVVRENRDLLINIHRYLAWILHSEAEQGKNRGSISYDELQNFLHAYLAKEQHDVTLVNKLFTGMVERVVALVSRVQGTYEFEVQTLREYFAARYLYETAPYSPPGDPKGGNILERFDAISRNFYWLNVTRFFAGCFSIGELPSLYDRLEEMARDSILGKTNHPYILSAILLADWVFTQQPRTMKLVISLIFSEANMPLFFTFDDKRSISSQFIFPNECGKKEVLQKCTEYLYVNPSKDIAMEILKFIKINTDENDLYMYWSSVFQNLSSKDKGDWISQGLKLNILHKITSNKLDELLSQTILEGPVKLELKLKILGIDENYIDDNIFNLFVDFILGGEIFLSSNSNSMLHQMYFYLDPKIYVTAFQLNKKLILYDILKSRYQNVFDITQNQPSKFEYIQLDSIKQFIDVAVSELKQPAGIWTTSIKPWGNIVEFARNKWGERWIIIIISIVSAAIRSKKEFCKEYNKLNEKSYPLCERVRYARLRAGDSRWWSSQFDEIEDRQQLLFALTVLFSWSSTKTISKLYMLNKFDLESLTDKEWSYLFKSVFFVRRFYFKNEKIPAHFSNSDIGNIKCFRTILLFTVRALPENSINFYSQFYKEYKGDERRVNSIILEICINALFTHQKDKIEFIDRIKSIYSVHKIWGSMVNWDKLDKSKLDYEYALLIVSSSTLFPLWLVRIAESVVRNFVGSKIIPVGQSAFTNNW